MTFPMTLHLLLELLFPGSKCNFLWGKHDKNLSSLPLFHEVEKKVGLSTWFNHCLLLCLTFKCVSYSVVFGLFLSPYPLLLSDSIYTLTFNYKQHAYGSKTFFLTSDSISSQIVLRNPLFHASSHSVFSIS